MRKKEPRAQLPFDTKYFAKRLTTGDKLTTEEKFNYIYKNNHWLGQYSISGQGSDDSQTEEIRARLPKIISDYHIQSLLDLPCGDFNWMGKLDLNLQQYIGGDIVEEIIQQNQAKYTNNQREFLKLDIIEDDLPTVDLIFCRDCWVHFSFEDVLKSIHNIKRSNSKYLLTTTFTDCEYNEDIVTGDWRIINLKQEPFNFPKEILLIKENCTEGNHTYNDKSLGLWKIAEL